MSKKLLSLLAILMMAITANAQTLKLIIRDQLENQDDYAWADQLYDGDVSIDEGTYVQITMGTMREATMQIWMNGEVVYTKPASNVKDQVVYSFTAGKNCKILGGYENMFSWGDYGPGNPNVRFTQDASVAVELNEATDNSTPLTTYDGQVANVTLTRTLQTGGWNTFCVPFSTATPSGWTVKELTASSFNSSTGALSLTFGNAASLVAGKPYLVKVTSNVVNPTFDGVTISKDAVTTETTAVDFVPTLGLTEISGDANDILFLSSGNTLLHPSSLPANMKGFRAYFLLKGEAALARSFSMDFGDGETTGIITIENGQSATGKAIYDLQGRRVNGTAQKGVYIVNGKKTVIK